MTTNLSQLTQEELSKEIKAVKKNNIIVAGLIGFCMGIIIYGIAAKGFGIVYTLIPIGLIFLLVRNSKKTKTRLAELEAALKNSSEKV